MADAASSLSSRARRAIGVHGVRGVVFAAARRGLTTLEDRLNPNHVNRFETGFTDVVKSPADPVAAVYRAEFRTVVIELPMASIRWSRLGMALDDGNPFVRTVREHLDGTCTSYERSALAAHFDRWRPASAAAVVGISEDGALGRQPPAAVVLPWMAESGDADPAERLRRVDRWNREETRAHGAEMGLEHGHKLFGPVSPEFGRAEYDRYVRLADAVRADGFVPFGDDGYVGVQLLVHGAEHVAVATGPGLHRTAVAAGAGVDPLVVAVTRLPTIVHRDDADRWPGVRSGLFTADEAVAVFDRVVAGSPPPSFPPHR